MTAKRIRVVVLFNAPVLPRDHPDAASEHDVIDVANAVAALLQEEGLEARTAAITASPESILNALASRPDVVFNLIEGLGGLSQGAHYATGMIELLRLPYTGCPVEALALCLDKSRAKALLRGFGIPTAPFAVVQPGEVIEEWPWDGPALVKPDAEDGSLGITQESVVSDLTALRQRVRLIHESYQGPALVEAYLPGREFNVGVVALPDPQALPVAEVRFVPADGVWPILTYDAKWSTGSVDDQLSPVVCPASLETDLSEQLKHLALRAYKATGCRDYARVDLRLNHAGEPMVLEVNPNPDIGPGAGWARALRASGRDYAGTLAAIVRQAFERDRQNLT